MLISVLYTLIVLGLGVYAFQSLLLTVLYLRHRRDATLSVEVKDGQWPRVAVQLPIFNEQHVVERLIDAAAALDYPPIGWRSRSWTIPPIGRPSWRRRGRPGIAAAG